MTAHAGAMESARDGVMSRIPIPGTVGRWLCCACAILALAHPLSVKAQDNESSQAPALLTQDTAPVIIDGRTLFRVTGISAYPATQRARGIADRIEQLARDQTIAPEDLRVVETPPLTSIVANRQRIMALVDADAHSENVVVDRTVLASVYKDRIAKAVIAYRHDRTPGVLILHLLYAAGATLALAVVLFALRRVFRWLHAVIEQRYKEKIRTLRIQAFPVIRAEQVWAALRNVLRVVKGLFLLAAVYAYLYYVFSLFPWTRLLGRWLLDILIQPLSVIALGIVDSIPNLIFIAILSVVVYYGLKMTRLFFSAVADGSVNITGFDRDWAWPTYKIVRLLVLAFAVVVAYPYIPGSDSAAFKGVSILLGVIFSLGSTSVIANVIAGYTMTYRRAFRLGDRIRVGDVVGDVLEMRLLVTHLRSLKNERLVVPNSVILNSNIVNYSSMAGDTGLILHTKVGIGYEVPWRQVEAMLIEAAGRTSGLLREPPPFVLQTALADFSVIYELNVFCNDASSMPRLYTALHQNILDVFNEYEVQIMTPAYEADPAEPKLVPKGQWYAEPAAPTAQRDTPQPRIKTAERPSRE